MHSANAALKSHVQEADATLIAEVICRPRGMLKLIVRRNGQAKTDRYTAATGDRPNTYTTVDHSPAGVVVERVSIHDPTE